MVTYPSSWFICIKLHTTKYFFLTFFTIIPIAIALLFIIWRFIHVDKEGVERTREQQRRQETEPTKRNNSESIKRKNFVAEDNGGNVDNITKTVHIHPALSEVARAAADIRRK